MTQTIRLTAAQAMVRWLSLQQAEDGSRFIEGVWAIFGHGNVAGLGEALHAHRDALPTWRGQNEQTMAHIAVAYAKASGRRKAMAVTSSIGPGATNMVTAAAVAHVNRLPVLFIPGDVFANRAPDPVLQQIEDFDDGTVSANDCFRPVVRYFDRISRPEHLLTALPRALRVMTDPANCGPVCLAFCQDTQAEAYDYPVDFFTPRVWHIRRPEPDARELAEAVAAILAAKRPLIVSGGGVLYSGAEATLLDFARAHNIPLVETQAGKGAVDWEEPLHFGSPGVTGTGCGNKLAAEADLVIGVGTRFQDFTTGSWTVFSAPGRKLLSINIHGYDASKRAAQPLVADAKVALERISAALDGHRFADPDFKARADWFALTDGIFSQPSGNELPSDAQIVGAVGRVADKNSLVMSASGSMPGVLHVLWRAAQGGYHMEYGFSCMGYEIAGAMGIKMARPAREVICLLGDGSWMMANSELATAVMMGVPITVVLVDNRGFGCINRLQKATGGAPFNNLLDDAFHVNQMNLDFVSMARGLGAHAVKAASLSELEAEVVKARSATVPTVIVIDADPLPGTGAGGTWWDVAVPEVSDRPGVNEARKGYEQGIKAQWLVN
ncbi:3D-(3,5/4)-trihydroxycyclohexane-1,2-dione acylhydrolase (decyclizing) [Pseudogemmobacter blasticus]|uniref:3D-(3,5/4)-trihydroxycyclohexane-1,2-dione acylhydrolase (Decyclizing) n=1 Tax=Fuscovulum blasticum DSM 2131 TaxID=1188250 RepID=A0A2T4JA55_FUSBL|nr:3D-(3,5/4)-trihydroxycyclohexane-1,2-dione acylhydrolase (decyclizing) [Fuscovulum blasticum]PTE14790.1 3D-(3,5/4)-trihydroxycyclohexane-1,2-dione acylhydrolase (decyclizing) [Fuscovulum blasticum DSM 2131]